VKRPLSAVLLAAMAAVACGKKGPPLPPLVRMPSPPADFAAELRGATVDLQFTVPAANTDNSRPANVQRVDVYAITTGETLTDAQILKLGTRVASVDVKAPRDPDNAIEEDEPPSDMEAPEGKGLDQGARAHLTERLAAGALTPAAIPRDRKRQQSDSPAADGPLVPPRLTPPTRTYMAVGVTTRDRTGPASKRIAVPLVPPPPPPARATITYDEKAITVKWPPVAARPPVQPAPKADELPAKVFGYASATVRYNVYDASDPTTPVKLTTTPVAEPTFTDPRIEWGARRCYVTRAVQTMNELSIESDAQSPVCETLKDTFPPGAPANLQSSPQEGAISLIWDANSEPDLDGYIVFRGPSRESLEPIVSAPVQLTQFRDETLQPGTRYVYVVRAVDKAGNRSAASNAVEEAAR
jgi:hypothetical protein